MPEDQVFTTKGAPIPRGPYVHARKHGGLVWVTGQIGRDPDTGDFVKGGFEAEFNQAIDNLKAILEAAGSSLANVVRTNVYLSDMGNFAAMNEVYATYFQAPYPARTTIQAAALPGGIAVEIDCVARR